MLYGGVSAPPGNAPCCDRVRGRAARPDLPQLRYTVLCADVIRDHHSAWLVCRCVSVGQARARGGHEHYLLPRRMEELASPRFGDVAIDRLVDGMTELGCRVGSLRAKIFGGAEVLPFGARGDTVGNQNVRIALELLRQHGIPILTRCTGGQSGILIRLYSETGDVAVRRVAAVHLEDGVPYSA